MNGVVMEESSEKPQQITDENTSNIPLLDDDGINGGKEQKDLPGQVIKQNVVELPSTKPEAIQDEKEVLEKNGHDSPSLVNEDITSPCKNIVENVDNQIIPIENLLSSTNGMDNNNDDLHLKEPSEPESELENDEDGLPEKIVSNSKDSSMLSTTDTQDELDTADNGVQLNSNYLHEEKKDSENIVVENKITSHKVQEEIQVTKPDPQSEESSSGVLSSHHDETSQESPREKTDDVKIVDSLNQNGNQRSEIHEINSDDEDDDCIVTSDIITSKKKTPKKKLPPTDFTSLRRSSRAKKRKTYEYGDDESDVEVFMNSSKKSKCKPILVNDVKALANIAKQPVRSISAPQLVLIGSNMSPKTATSMKSTSSSISASLYQSIVARGTTVTPVGSKPAPTTVAGSKSIQTKHGPTTTTQACQTPTPVILPSLTDDMFVVEAPSFIVPYVYEKPSIEPFKELVTNLGKKLQEQRAKAEQEEKEKRKKERQEKRDRGEEVVDSEEEVQREAHKKKKAEMKVRKRQEEEDDKSWNGSDTTDSDDYKITDENGRTIDIVDKDDIEEIKSSQLVPETAKSENYFDCSLGKFFMNIGMGLVEEYVQSDLLKQQKRKLHREKKSGRNTTERERSITLLTKNLELSKENNIHYSCAQLKCEHCSFKTESALVLAQHLETPHMKNNMYKCNFCTFEIRSPQDILFHMEAEHKVRGKLERAPSHHQCANCPFEDNGKGKLARHIIACAKKFKPEQNLNPPFEWEPPAKIPKVAKARNTLVTPYASGPNAFGRQQFGSGYGRTPTVTGPMPIPGNYRPRGSWAPQTSPMPGVPLAGGSIVRGSSMLRQNTPCYPGVNSKKLNPMSLSITALPRQPPPAHLQPGQNTKGTFVICEICDGYIKDLDQLRNHMQWIHKVKIHPKMIYNRPPLNCQKCQFRFFTDQGLERHLLGSHGLVTSSMQEAANKSKDAGRCPVCGKVYQWKLLNHVARDHNLTLKPAHLSYKCTVCTATFGMYKLFENHVYSAHSVVAKRVMDKNAPKAKDGAPKAININDEITITAQTSKPTKK